MEINQSITDREVPFPTEVRLISTTGLQGDINFLNSDVIIDIAEQTNLLALNTAIEAVRTGETGLDFTRVADEVRNLAQHTQQPAHDTCEILQGLKGDTQACVESINDSVAASQQIVELAGQTDHAFDLILKSVEHLHLLAREVNVAIYEKLRITAHTPISRRPCCATVQARQ